MKSQRSISFALVTLSYALVLLSNSILAGTISDDSSYNGCTQRFIGDGDCDLTNDNEDCEYDGGDCCECTCVSTAEFTCGENGGFACVDPSAPCVDDDDVTTLPDFEVNCIDAFIADGDCDDDNNYEECDYDGGDCCECTCVSTFQFTCGDTANGGFACIDPRAPCSDDDDFNMFDDDDDEDMSASFLYQLSVEAADFLCIDELIGDGDCQLQNNNEGCGYDGGDCCECTCDPTIQYGCDLYFDPADCIDPSAPCVNNYIEAGSKTTVGVSANAYDTRPGLASNMVGCQEDGCSPSLTRDGISDDIESRWSCARAIVPDGGFCEIMFTFESPQDIVDIQVAFPYDDESARSLEVEINGEVIGTFTSYLQPWLTFNGLGVKESEVGTVALRHTSTDKDEWMSILEVRFLVEP